MDGCICLSSIHPLRFNQEKFRSSAKCGKSVRLLHSSKSNENLSDIFSPSENRKTLGLTFYKDYNIYKINNILGLTNNELNKTLNFTEGSYIIFFHKDNEYNTIKK